MFDTWTKKSDMKQCDRMKWRKEKRRVASKDIFMINDKCLTCVRINGVEWYRKRTIFDLIRFVFSATQRHGFNVIRWTTLIDSWDGYEWNRVNLCTWNSTKIDFALVRVHRRYVRLQSKPNKSIKYVIIRRVTQFGTVQRLVILEKSQTKFVKIVFRNKVLTERIEWNARAWKWT